MTREKVLFLCTGNSARSQMAEGLLRHLADYRYQVHSAGLAPRDLNHNAVIVMRELDIDISGYTSKHLDEYLGKLQFNYLITVCDDADEQCPTVPDVQQRLHWSFEDPTKFNGPEDETLNKFREVRDQIQNQIETWLKVTPPK